MHHGRRMPAKVSLIMIANDEDEMILQLYLNKEGSTRMEICKLFCGIQLVFDADMVLWNGSDGLICPLVFRHY